MLAGEPELPGDEAARPGQAGERLAFRLDRREQLPVAVFPGDVRELSVDGAEPPRPLDATGRAERWILGILLLEPGRWMRVQRSVRVEDFSVPLHRRLAEVYWDHQRHEGEPVFNEFLGQLGGSDAALVDLAGCAGRPGT